jgi:hypothetical protein
MRLAIEHERSETARVTPSPITDSTLDASLEFDRDGHGPFRNMCLVYGDFHRTVFLQEIINWFVRSASKVELAALRKAVSWRSAHVSKGGKRGRPRERDDAAWLVKAKVEAWHRIVEGWTWWKIAESEGLKPTRKNIRTIERTLTRRQDRYAAIIWEACRSIAGVWKKMLIVPVHRGKGLPKGLFLRVLKGAGFTLEEFREG